MNTPFTQNWDAAFVSETPALGLIQRVHAAVAEALASPEARVRLVQVARKVGMSTRSLQRRLAEEATSLSNVLDDVRRDRAIALLAQDDVPLATLARDLGFASVPACVRAFRRWTGQSPRAYQRATRQAALHAATATAA